MAPPLGQIDSTDLGSTGTSVQVNCDVGNTLHVAVTALSKFGCAMKKILEDGSPVSVMS